MSTTVKTGWLNDKNGDKFAPKTLTSQVQTSDGILIEDKIQTDLDTVKQEILDEIDKTKLDAIDPNTIMNYKGEVNELPETAKKGEVYKLTQNIGDITNVPLITDNNILMENVANIGMSDGFFYFAMFSSNRFEIPSSILALVSDLLGTTEFNDEGAEIPTKTISIIVDGNTYNIKTNYCQWSKYEEEGVYAINLAFGGECPELADDYLQIAGYNDDGEFVVNYQNVSIKIGGLEYRANSYILYNGNEWVEFSRNNFTEFITQSDMETYVDAKVAELDPNTIMNYLGEVNELPTSANKGDIYKVTSDIVPEKIALITDGVDNVGFPDMLILGTHYNGLHGQQSDAEIYHVITELLTGDPNRKSMSFSNTIPIHFLIDGNECILYANSISYPEPEEDGYFSFDVQGTISPENSYLDLRIASNLTIWRGDVESYLADSFVIYNGITWETLSKNKINNLQDGESEGSIKTANAGYTGGIASVALGAGAISIGNYSIALGRDIVAGCKAYYIKSIDLENKKIYLTNEQIIPTIDVADNTDVNFETPGYEVGEQFTIKNDNHYNYCGTIVSISNNVVTYSEESLGFTQILTNNGLADMDNYSFRVPTKPDIGSAIITGHSYAEGRSNYATGGYSHAEGYATNSDGNFSHTEGRGTKAAYAAHAEGRDTIARGNYSHAEGLNTQSLGVSSHSEGQSTIAKSQASHAEGMNNQSLASYSHTEGYENVVEADAKQAHAEGKSNIVRGVSAHAEGAGNTVSGQEAHAEGGGHTVEGNRAHAEGTSNIAKGSAAHAEGNGTESLGSASHSEGFDTLASADQAHAEGYKTKATYQAAHAEGYNTQATKIAAHAEGSSTEATGDGAHAEGYDTTASGPYSHAEGASTHAKSYTSHAEGVGTIARGNGQHVEGRYNIEDTAAKYGHILGGGTSTTKKNVHTVDWNGQGWFANSVKVGGTGQDDSTAKTLATETYVDETIATQIGGKANSDLSNVDNATFKAKAEEAGVCGDAGLMGDNSSFKGEINDYTELPTEATEGDIYYVSNYYTDFDINNLAFDSYVTGTQYTTGCNYTPTFAYKICELEGISAPTDISSIHHTINIPYVVIAKVNKYYTSQKYFAIEIYKLMARTMDDGEGGTDSEYLAFFEDKCNAEYLRKFQDGIFVNYQALSISSSNKYYYAIIPKSDIHEYPKGAYIYSAGKWKHV